MRVFCVVGVLLCVLGAQAAFAKGETHLRVIVPLASLYRSADYEGKIVRKAAAGEALIAVSEYHGFYLVKDEQSDPPSFVYVAPEAVEITNVKVSKKILISGHMPMPDKQDLSYWQVVPTDHYRGGGDGGLMLRSRSEGGYATAPNGKKYPNGYNPNRDYRPHVDGEQLVRDAMQYVGAPYVLGGTSTRGIDCSGLTQVCLGKQGFNVVHRASLQALEGRFVNYDQLEPGDLVFFRDDDDLKYLSHVGIYVGGGKFVHASVSYGGVAVTPLSAKYFKQHYAFARRL